jgi:hypothetical protein
MLLLHLPLRFATLLRALSPSITRPTLGATSHTWEVPILGREYAVYLAPWACVRWQVGVSSWVKGGAMLALLHSRLPHGGEGVGGWVMQPGWKGWGGVLASPHCMPPRAHIPLDCA